MTALAESGHSGRANGLLALFAGSARAAVEVVEDQIQGPQEDLGRRLFDSGEPGNDVGGPRTKVVPELSRAADPAGGYPQSSRFDGVRHDRT